MSYNIQAYTHQYLDSAATLYAQTYAVAGYNGLSGTDISREVIVDLSLRDDFVGVLALDADENVVGFAWGYGTPTNNPRITAPVIKYMGAQWVENTFMVDGFLLHFEHQHPDLAQSLLDQLTGDVQAASYERMRMRVNLPRVDDLLAVLYYNEWADLKSLAHVLWIGREIALSD